MKYLFISPHFDDFEIGALGYLKNLNKKDDALVVYLNNLNFRSSYEEISKIKNLREQEFNFLKNQFNINIKYNTYSLEVLKYKNQEFIIQQIFENLLKDFKPDIIITCLGDNHQDHKIVDEISLRVFRPFFIKKLIKYEVPMSSYNFQANKFNFYNLLNEIEFDIKRTVLKMLEQYFDKELKNKLDARSIDFVIDFNKLNGKFFNKFACERYLVEFEKV